jgi:hypothetical protein
VSLKTDQRLVKVGSRNISVVIQGPLYRSLARTRSIDACLTAVRTHLPHAEIIISTWTDQDFSGIDTDIVLASADPGVFLDNNGNRNNINRQIISTVAGLKASTRDYALKLRADHILTGSQFAVMGEYDLSIPKVERLLNQPITVSTIFIRNPAKVPMLFHISDSVHFGTREDMIAFWDQRPKTRDELYVTRPNMNPIGNFVGCTSMRIVPEQSLMLGFLAKNGFDISLKNPTEISPELVRLSENLIAKNFTFLNWRDCQIDFPERFRKSFHSIKTVYEARELKAVAELDPYERKARYRKIWLNKYVFSFTRLVWWFSFATIMLTAVSPSLAKTARAIMRKILSLEHPHNDRV